jgi:hypothetical protein
MLDVIFLGVAPSYIKLARIGSSLENAGLLAPMIVSERESIIRFRIALATAQI